MDHWENKLVDVGEDKEENVTEMMAALAKKKKELPLKEKITQEEQEKQGQRPRGDPLARDGKAEVSVRIPWEAEHRMGGRWHRYFARISRRRRSTRTAEFRVQRCKVKLDDFVEKKRFKKRALRHRVVVCQVLQLAGDRTCTRRRHLSGLHAVTSASGV